MRRKNGDNNDERNNKEMRQIWKFSDLNAVRDVSEIMTKLYDKYCAGIIERNNKEMRQIWKFYAFLIGRPMYRSSASASFLFVAVVLIVIAIPKMSFRSSSEVSGKTVCSLIPMV